MFLVVVFNAEGRVHDSSSWHYVFGFSTSFNFGLSQGGWNRKTSENSYLVAPTSRCSGFVFSSITINQPKLSGCQRTILLGDSIQDSLHFTQQHNPFGYYVNLVMHFLCYCDETRNAVMLGTIIYVLVTNARNNKCVVKRNQHPIFKHSRKVLFVCLVTIWVPQ